MGQGVCLVLVSPRTRIYSHAAPCGADTKPGATPEHPLAWQKVICPSPMGWGCQLSKSMQLCQEASCSRDIFSHVGNAEVEGSTPGVKHPHGKGDAGVCVASASQHPLWLLCPDIVGLTRGVSKPHSCFECHLIPRRISQKSE